MWIATGKRIFQWITVSFLVYFAITLGWQTSLTLVMIALIWFALLTLAMYLRKRREG